MNQCPACLEIIESIRNPSTVIYEDTCWMVSHKTGEDAQLGNLIIKTKRHCEHLAELTQEETTLLGEVIQKTCLALSRVIDVKKVYVASYGEGVKHVHFFVIPRTELMPVGNIKVFLYQRIHSFLIKCGIKKKLTQEDKFQIVKLVGKEYRKLLESQEAS